MVAVLLFCATFTPALAAQTPAQKKRAEEVLNSMPKARTIEQADISPDGHNVAWISEGRVHAVAVDPANQKETPHEVAIPGGLQVREVAWSRDSQKLACIVDEGGEVPASQLVVSDGHGAGMRKLASLRGYVSALSFSPQGNTLAVLFVENMPRKAGPLVPMTPASGVIEERVFEQRLTTVDLGDGKVKQVSPADEYVYEYDWSPDGKSWVVSAAPGSGDNNWWLATLSIMDESGALRQIVKPKLQVAVPRFSPDGKNIAYIHGIMSDQGATGGDIYVVPAAGGEPRNLTPEMKASAVWLTWSSPQDVLFTANRDGNSAVMTVPADGGQAKQLWIGFEMLSADGWSMQLSLARDGKTSAVVRQSFSDPPEVWAGNIGSWRKITSLNAGLKPGWGKASNFHWVSDDQNVQGWLLEPRDYDPSKEYPVIIHVHGGPSAACMPRWNTFEGAGSAMGWFVLCPNPRGSYGQGEAFTQANVKDFGGGDFRDVMNGVDALLKEYPIDPKRMGIFGHSYGGYMTMWVETQTNRFAAAVAGAGLSDWLSYYGENDIDEWMVPFFGASVYDDPAVYARSSPINFVKNVKTPTLILVGDRDGEVPAPQSFEWWHALKTLGVPVELVVYPNEGHSISQPSHRHDYELRTLEWFERWFAVAEKKDTSVAASGAQ